MKPHYHKTFHLPVGKIHIMIYGKDENPLSLEETLSKVRQKIQRKMFLLQQVHGSEYIDLRKNIPENNGVSFDQEADAIISNQKDYALVIKTADCVPIFFWHPEKLLFGGIHVGWRGLAKKTITKTLQAVDDRENLYFWVGPHIQPLSYEVGEEVYSLFLDECSMPTSPNPGKRYLNLNCIVHHELEDLGIDNSRVFYDREDTFHSNLLYSHRGGDSGRNLNILYWESI
ncbi:MAG: laccase domain-containing protein [Candidatus Hydrogenedentota bacterium]|nr:MAG: laccase domain-containing protein [Candidatus Hydrogenedentota bacterium]